MLGCPARGVLVVKRYRYSVKRGPKKADAQDVRADVSILLGPLICKRENTASRRSLPEGLSRRGLQGSRDRVIVVRRDPVLLGWTCDTTGGYHGNPLGNVGSTSRERTPHHGGARSRYVIRDPLPPHWRAARLIPSGIIPSRLIRAPRVGDPPGELDSSGGKMRRDIRKRIRGSDQSVGHLRI